MDCLITAQDAITSVRYVQEEKWLPNIYSFFSFLSISTPPFHLRALSLLFFSFFFPHFFFFLSVYFVHTQFLSTEFATLKSIQCLTHTHMHTKILCFSKSVSAKLYIITVVSLIKDHEPPIQQSGLWKKRWCLVKGSFVLLGNNYKKFIQRVL